MRKSRVKKGLFSKESTDAPVFEEEDFIMVNDFENKDFNEFLTTFSRLERDNNIENILIFINSLGGDVINCQSMRDLIKSCSKPVYTIAIGNAQSSGCDLLASGHKGLRYAAPSSVIMMHNANMSYSYMEGLCIREELAQDEWLEEMSWNNFSEDTGLSKEEIYTIINSRKSRVMYFKPEEAKEKGIIDHIGIPKVNIYKKAP